MHNGKENYITVDNGYNGSVWLARCIPLSELVFACLSTSIFHRFLVQKTARKAVEGTGPIQRVKALALLRVINELLGTSYRPEDIDGLEID
jgi:hypothetical protein